MVTISTHPMLQPCVSQPFFNFQVSHSLPKTILMPHDDEASTQNSVDEMGGGFERIDPQNSADSWERHQSIFERMLALGDLWTNGEEK